MRRNYRALEAIEHLGRAEDDFLKREFLAPVLRGQSVSVRVAGIIYQMAIEPADFEGWGVFRPLTRSSARLQREATLRERQEYLGLFPRVLLLVAGRSGDRWLGRLAHQGDGRLRLSGFAPLGLAIDVQPFDTVRTIFDGSQFWYGAKHPARARYAAYLRTSLNGMVHPDSINQSGLTPEERRLYSDVFILRKRELEEAERVRAEEEREALRDRTEERLRRAFSHAGADLISYRELSDAYTVTISVDGYEHSSVLDKTNLAVVAAGICLNGQDGDFDAQSLVSVLREGHRRGLIHRVGIPDEW